MIQSYVSGKSVKDVLRLFCKFVGKVEKDQYAKLIAALSLNQPSESSNFVVNSIESIKGLEGNRCLFILTSDLAAYLFGNKTTENKTKNALYVALTRSLNILTILISKEVKDEYGKENISKYFSYFNAEVQAGKPHKKK